MRRWLIEGGRDPLPFLESADLVWVPPDDPDLPIPLRFGLRLLVGIAHAEGPDAPYRMVNGRGGFEIGLIGAAAFSGDTLHDCLNRMVKAMPLHCTHEIFSVTPVAKGLRIQDGWTTDLGDPEARHLVQQYVAAIVDMICGTIAGVRPCLSHVAMVPHPSAGLSHLQGWLGDRLEPAAGGPLDILIPSRLADSPVPALLRAQAPHLQAPPGPILSRELPPLSDDVVTLVSAMLTRTTPSIVRAAAAAGTSARTLRRNLRQEGHSFTDLVEYVRARITLRRLQEEPTLSLRALAGELGYANQATLSRAVRRWKGTTPTEMRGCGSS